MKIWSKLFLVLATGMMMFSSCLETIEPEGLSDLRGAKADLLRAQTALQEAQAAKVNAEAALVLAEAKVQEAVAKQKEAEIAYIEVEIKKMEAMVEYQNLLNEREAIINAGMEAANAAEAEAARIANERALAELEARLAEIEAAKATAAIEAEKAAAQLKADLLEIQTELVEAQAAYEVAMKELAAAKVALSPAQVAYLAPFKYDVAVAQLEVDNLATQLETAAENLAAAIATVDKKKADKLAIRTAELDVVAKEAALLGAQEAEEIAKAALELDPKVTDWAAEKAELEAEYDAMEKARREALLETDDKNAELEAKYNELVEAYQEYTAATGFSFNEETGEFSVVPGSKTPLTAPDIFVPAPKDEDGNNMFFPYFGTAPDFYADNWSFQYGDADYDGLLTYFDNVIDFYAGINSETYDAIIAGLEAQIKSIEEASEDHLAQYEAAVAAYKAKDAVSYYEEYETVWTGEYDGSGYQIYAEYDVNTAVEEYNVALNAVVAAVNKYNTEWAERDPGLIDEELAEIEETYSDEIATAETRKWTAYQEARDPYYEASKTWQNAKLAYKRAGEIRDAKISAILAEAGYPTVTSLETAIADYLAEKAANADNDTFDADGTLKAKYDKNVAYKASIDKANKDFDDGDEKTTTDPQSVYDAASKVWEEAGKTYQTAIDKADKDYNAATTAAENKRKEAIENLNVGLDDTDPDYVDPMESDYFVSLYKEFVKAFDVWADKFGAVNRHARITSEPSVLVLGAEGEKLHYEWPDYPSYFVDEETQELKEIKVADIVDNEYFLANTVKNIADSYAAKVRVVNFQAYNDETEKYTYDFPVVIGAPADYPLSLPTYESFTQALEEFDGTAIEFATEEFRKFENECIASGGFVYRYGSFDIDYAGTPLDEIFYRKDSIENQDENIANIEVAAAHVEVLEAAKAEFEAYVAAEEERIDALRTMVEAEWAENAEAVKAFKDAQIAYAAEMAEIQRVVNHITLMIDTYIGTTDVDFFVSTLEATYATCVEAVDQAEFDLEIAKDQLEVVKAGGEDAISAVELAQKAYDKLNAKLQEALAELEAAADALEEAMAAIGEGTVEEEAPEAPETPAE